MKHVKFPTRRRRSPRGRTVAARRPERKSRRYTPPTVAADQRRATRLRWYP